MSHLPRAIRDDEVEDAMTPIVCADVTATATGTGAN
jgi:hypothetical protein